MNPKTPDRPVVAVANWGNEDKYCPMAVTTWNRIISGFNVIRTVPYYHEGELFKSWWEFNINGNNTVRITYSKAVSDLGEGLGFEGAISDLRVTYFERKVNGLSKLIKLGRLYKKFEIYFEELRKEDSSITFFYVYVGKKQTGHLLNFTFESTQAKVIRKINFKGLRTAKEVIDRITSGWNQLFAVDPPVRVLKQILLKIEQKDPELASLMIREPSLNHAQTLFEWN